MAITTIIFDLGGVLLDIDMPRCLHEIEALGVDVQAMMAKGDAQSPHGATLCEGMTASGTMHLYQIGAVTTDDFLESIRRCCRPGTTRQQVLDAWNTCLITIPPFKLEAIKALRRQGYRTYMLSNTNEAHWEYIEQTCFPEPVSHYFDDIFMSQRLGLAKPDRRFYEEVLRCIGVPPSSCLFLDDTQVNCDAAAALGIHVCKTEIAKTNKQGAVVRPATEWPDFIDQLLH